VEQYFHFLSVFARFLETSFHCFHGGRLACFVVNEGSLLIYTGNIPSMSWFILCPDTVRLFLTFSTNGLLTVLEHSEASPYLTVLGWWISATLHPAFLPSADCQQTTRLLYSQSPPPIYCHFCDTFCLFWVVFCHYCDTYLLREFPHFLPFPALFLREYPHPSTGETSPLFARFPAKLRHLSTAQ